MRRILPAIAFLLSLPLSGFAAPATQPIHWVPWSDQAFADAKAQHKLVLMDLHAVWCHWCHVMDDTTYADADVQKLLADHYIAIGVDADSRPDLANRYEDYGWPATIVFDGDGKEIVKRRGYLPPGTMKSMLQAIVDDPTPGPSVQPELAVTPASTAILPKDVREKLIAALHDDYDAKSHGWAGGQRFVDVDVIDFCLTSGDAVLEKMATDTLAANQQLIDPAWGGVYQYSTDEDWVHPHFEKVMSFQADDLRAYSHAYAKTGDPSDFAAAVAICGYLKHFLTGPDGAFYTSQDADLIDGQHAGEYFALGDADRRKLGIPQIDQHIYARENGWSIIGLVAYYAAAINEPNHAASTGENPAAIATTRYTLGHHSFNADGTIIDPSLDHASVSLGSHDATAGAASDRFIRAGTTTKPDAKPAAADHGRSTDSRPATSPGADLLATDVLSDAVRAANWIIAHRSQSGGFSHDEHDAAGPYLGDTLAMGRAFLALYAATADRQWLGRAQSAADFIAATFTSAAGAGFLTAANDSHARPEVDENTQLARFANLLYAYTGNKANRTTAETAMRYAASPQVIGSRHWLVGGILLADQELAADPLHVAIVGSKNDPLAKELFTAALATSSDYIRREWFDAAEGPLPRQDVTYPALKIAAAFLCDGNACSRPMENADQLRKTMKASK